MADAPHLGSMRPGRWLGILLYLLLGIAAATALLGGTIHVGALAADRVGVGVFAGFLVVFAAYRFTLVRAGRYSLGKTLYQVGAALLLLLVLAYGTLGPARSDEGGDRVGYLLRSADGQVRQAGCELARLRGDPRYLPLVEAHLADRAEVAAECRRAADDLGRLRGGAPH